MARLIVETIVSSHGARAGTTDEVLMTVSVTHANGQPDISLTQAHFIVGDTFGRSRVSISYFHGPGVQVGLGAVNAYGLYMIKLVPIAGATWVSGVPYHLVVVINDGTNHGQTVAELYFP